MEHSVGTYPCPGTSQRLGYLKLEQMLQTMPSRCKWNGAWGLWICDHQPWRKPARLDLRVPGFTYTTAGSWAAPPTPDNYIGWVSQFGADNRRAVITRNEVRFAWFSDGALHAALDHPKCVPRHMQCMNGFQ